jgi:hypothetical protein
MPNYTLTLTEVADGIGDHGNYKKRRASAIVIATNLSVTNQAGNPIADNGTDIVHHPASAGQPWTYTWYVQGTSKNVKKLVNVFNAFEYVTVTGGPP